MNIGSTGAAGEDAALNMYLEKGYVLVERNYQTRYGEIDLIVKNDRYMVFAEVKTRTGVSRFRGCEDVTRSKMRKIFKTAVLYMQSVGCSSQLRFDVVDIFGHWVVVGDKEEFSADRITLYENAFGSEVYNGFI